MRDEAFYKERAREARKLAEQARDMDLRQVCLQIAQDYDALADTAGSFQTRYPN